MVSLLDLTSDKNKFWLQDFTILYEDDAYLKFIPTKEMTYIQKLNALSRFFIYGMILLIIFKKSRQWIYIPLVGLTGVIVLYGIYKQDPDSGQKEVNKIMNDRKETFGMNDNEKTNNVTIESGIVNSDGIVNTGVRQYSPKYIRETDQGLYTLEELERYNKSTCRKPTSDNPYMNPLVTDYCKDNVPVACNIDDEHIRDQVVDKFNSDMFMDVEDVHDKANSQRQFYTVPNTSIPSNQEDFANWCYRAPVTCKEDQEQCLRYEDLRFKR